MFIRTANERDLSAVSQLIAETTHATFDGLWGAAEVSRLQAEWFSPRSLVKYLERQRSEFLVADDGALLGGVAFGAAAGDDARIVELDMLVVRSNLQGGGIGGLLLEEFESSFFESELVRLEVDHGNTRAIRFYEDAGYVEIDRKAGTKPPAMRLILQKSLV